MFELPACFFGMIFVFLIGLGGTMLENPLWMLGIGIAVGWLLEWMIDLRFFRPRLKKGNAALAKMEEFDRLKARVSDHNKLIEELLQKNADLKEAHAREVALLREDLDYARSLATQQVVAEASGVEIQKTIYTKAVTRDQLQKIAGIGPKSEELLWKAGIYRFCQIADLTASELADIIMPEPWQNLDLESWVREASRLASGKIA